MWVRSYPDMWVRSYPDMWVRSYPDIGCGYLTGYRSTRISDNLTTIVSHDRNTVCVLL